MLLTRKSDKAYSNNKLTSLLRLNKYDEIIDMFETMSPCNLMDLCGKTVLHLAAEHENLTAIDHLSAQGANVDAQDKQGVTQLMTAIKRGHVKSVVTMLKINAHICGCHYTNVKRPFQSIIFRFAVKMPLNIVKMFFEQVKIRNRVDLRIATKELMRFNCPLYCVALLQNSSIFKHMLDRGASATSGCIYTGNTVLHVAVQFSIWEIAELLIERGVDVNMTNKTSETALMLYPVARSTGEDLRVLRLLLCRGACLVGRTAHGKIQVHTLLTRGTAPVVREVLRYMPDLGVRDALGQTPLHYLLQNRSDGVVEQLAGRELQLQLDAFDHFGRSSVHLAAERAIPRNVQYLLRRGANANASGDGGATPLFSVLSSLGEADASGNAAQCIELLLRHGADIQFVAGHRRTVFDTGSKRDEASGAVASWSPAWLAAVLPIVAYLALSESRGTATVTELTLAKINSCLPLRYHLMHCRRQLRQIRRLVDPPLVGIFFKCLADSDEKVVRLARNRKLTSKLLSAIKQLSRQSSYSISLRNLLRKAVSMIELQDQAIPNLCRIKYLCSNRLVVNKIISYMNEQDLRILSQF